MKELCQNVIARVKKPMLKSWPSPRPSTSPGPPSTMPSRSIKGLEAIQSAKEVAGPTISNKELIDVIRANIKWDPTKSIKRASRAS